MFPHPFDRYKLLYLLINHFHEKSGMDQAELKRKAKLSQSTVSNLLNEKRLSRVFRPGKRTAIHKPFNLETLIKACSALGVDPDLAAALEWLLEGQQRTGGKVHRRMLLKVLDQISGEEFERIKLKQNDELEEITIEIARRKGFFDVEKAEANFNSQSESLQKRLRQISNQPGHRMVVSKFPTSATHPRDADPGLSVQAKLRVDAFKKNISADGYGERHIHSKPTIERYLRADSKCSFLPIEKRREHIEILIRTLEDDQSVNFEIGLADIEPEIELAMHSIDVVGIRTTAREFLPNAETFSCGPAYVLIHDPFTVLSCYLDFEREWSQIPKRFRQRSRVVKWLRGALARSV